MATPEQVWQDFLDQFEDKYDETLGQAIPTSHRGSTQRNLREDIVAKLGPQAIIEIRRRQDLGQSDGKIVRDLMNKAAANLTSEKTGITAPSYLGGSIGGGTDYSFTFIDTADEGDQADVMFTGLFTERTAEPKGTIEYPDELVSGASGDSGRGTTGGGMTLEAQAEKMAGELGSYVPYKDGAYWIIYNEDKGINAVFGANSDGELEYKASSVDGIAKDDVSIKYTFGYDLDGKQYRMNNDTGDIEVKETLSGQFGMPGQGAWRSGTIRMVEGPEEDKTRWGTYTKDGVTYQYDMDNPGKTHIELFTEKEPIDWITYTNKEGTWQQDANDPTNRTKIADAQQEIGFSTRFNPATQQYETVRIDVRTGDMITAGGDKGDGCLGQSYDTFADTRDFDQRASQFESSEGRLGRQFNTTDARLRDEFRQTFGEDVRQFDLGFGENVRQFDTRFGEDVRQFDLGFGEDQRQFNLGFGETQRQFDTTEGRMERTLAANNYFNSLEELGRNYRTFVQTSPQLANAATNQGELIRNILTNGGDVLARTYFTRGGISPLPEITQADLINNLNDEMQKIQTFEQQGIQAENARRARADMERARGEYEQFAEFQRQTPQFTTRDIFDEAGFGAAQTAYQQSLGDMSDEAKAGDEAALAAHTAAGPDSYIQAAVAAISGKGTLHPDATAAAVERGNTAYANETARLQGQVASHTTMGPDRAQFTETIREQIPVPTFQSWAQSQGPSFAPTPLLNVPNVPTPQRTNQAQLIAQSRATTPPAVASVLSGQMPTPLQFGGLPLPTFQQLQALTPTEQEMLNSRLMTEFNVPLSDVAFQSQRQFGTPSMERNRDLARFRGYAV